MEPPESITAPAAQVHPKEQETSRCPEAETRSSTEKPPKFITASATSAQETRVLPKEQKLFRRPDTETINSAEEPPKVITAPAAQAHPKEQVEEGGV